jgi:hypothetical protein
VKVRRIAAVLMSTATAAAMIAAPAGAQQSGLVNVDVSNNTVQVPISVAANVCGLQVGVLATALAQGPVSCQSGATSVSQSTGAGGGAGGPQQGLVNLAITNDVIQVPVGIAANICDLQVAVLAQGLAQGPVNCTAAGNSGAGA